MSDGSGSSKRRKGSSGEPLPSVSEGPQGDATPEASTTDFDRRVKALVEEILRSQEGAGPSTASGSRGVVAEGAGKKPGSCSGTVAGRFNSCRSAVVGSGGVSWGRTDRLSGCNY